MKVFNTILKIVAALVLVAGVLYAVVTYGDKIVAWAKKLWSKLECCCTAEQDDVITDEIFDTEETAVTEEESVAEVTEEPVQEEDFEG